MSKESSSALDTLKALNSRLGPAITHAAALASAAEPHVLKAWARGHELWEKAAPYHPEDLVPCFGGACLVFFGGSFAVTLAAAEAYRVSGAWDATWSSALELWDAHKKAEAACAKDADAQTTPDSPEERLQRRLLALAKTTDPARLQTAIGAVSTGFMAVAATLRVRFARSVTVGATLGDLLKQEALARLEAPLTNAVEKEYQKWVAPGIAAACKLVGILIAWMIQRTISAFHTAVRGAKMLVRGALSYGVKHGHLEKPVPEESPLFVGAVGAVAFVGFWTQLWRGGGLPFPLNILLVPLRILEWALTFFLAR
mmetsp:Transcript_15240/g.50048  ORF Transcript_15240/g.50048 Transcript_15240/m.50048 type:complete len:313 (+) Transcript_15240:51-989(+)|eukprot:CAMPEP_0170135118 /NCGR_PEP_ID=MMETSP0033_2-20121228/2317_1 /TAXON_ID=195969 /ORGANISM="Dolichomastix tenuilepis, Strain CCMP3274" /LENGTH=312 /DNA_ID=CAMNT_0010370713 /DNA_START=51 /DNA_END=989 /DNA_ORIENTATION=+